MSAKTYTVDVLPMRSIVDHGTWSYRIEFFIDGEKTKFWVDSTNSWASYQAALKAGKKALVFLKGRDWKHRWR